MKPKKESFFKGKIRENSKKKVYGSSGGTSYLTLPNGISLLIFEEEVKKVQMDFLPYIVTDSNHPDKDETYEVAMKGGQWYRRPFLLHRSIGAGNKSYICPQSIGKKCPICEAQAGMWDTDRDGAVALYPKPRYLYIPIPLDSKKHEPEPVYIWDMAESLFHDTLKEALEEDDDNESFPDLEYGKTLELTFKWKQIGEGRPFPETRHIKFIDRDPYDEDLLEEVPNLDEIIKDSVLSYEELKAAFFETDVENEGGELEEEEEEKETKRSSTRRTRPSRKDEEEKDEDEPEEKPKKVQSRTEMTPAKKVVSRPTRNAKPKEEEPEEEEIDIPIKERCIACKGTGKDSRGHECPICNGTGRKPIKKVSEKPKGDDDCPSGYEFGKDHATQDECDDCDLWNECLEAKSKLKHKK
jgi:hypothetical protein